MSSSTVYRKTLKGTEEVAFGSYSLSDRMRPYLMMVDGVSNIGILQARNAAMPSFEMVLQSLANEGFIEIAQQETAAQNADKVVPMPVARFGGGGFAPAAAPQAAPAQPRFSQPQAVPAPAQPRFTQPEPPVVQPRQPMPPVQAQASRISKAQIDAIKSEMIRDVSSLLGKDAPLVINKITSCQSTDELFASLMGLKKIISMYTTNAYAEQFGTKYAYIASL
jgi:hypothetical protein